MEAPLFSYLLLEPDGCLAGGPFLLPGWPEMLDVSGLVLLPLPPCVAAPAPVVAPGCLADGPFLLPG